jgi:AraC-like DNA-binding protein
MMESPISFSHVRLFPSDQITMHWHPFWELSWVIRGHGLRTVGDDIEPFTEGDVVLVPPDCPHRWNFDKDDVDENGHIENITLLFSTQFFQGITQVFPEYSEAVSSILVRNNAVQYRGVSMSGIQATLKKMDTADPMGRVPLLFELLGFMSAGTGRNLILHSGRGPRKEDKIEMLRIWTTCNYHRRITLDELSRYLGMNKSSLCTYIRKHTGKTFTEYVNDYRLNLATKMLEKGKYTVGEVCFACGFADLSYFSRLFRKTFGTSPSKYGKG